MNKRQLKVMWIAISIALLFITFPPRHKIYPDERKYKFFLDDPANRVDIQALSIQFVGLALVTCGMFATAATKRNP